MRWVITQDLETPPGEKSIVGHGSRSAGRTRQERLSLASSLAFEFRLLDDDSNVYYHGRANDWDFDPLDWAKVYAGCTEIQFRNGDRWETL